MLARLRRVAAFVFSSPPLLLAGVTLLAYGLLFPWLGFYWDEWPMTWIAHRQGTDGLARYFATNRPYWGMIYRLTTPLLGYVPWHWQLFGLFWRWVTAVALWGTLRQVWPRHPEPALWASLLFLVYPGFTQQSIGMMYGHFFVVLSAYLLSLWCSLKAVRMIQAARATRAADPLQLRAADPPPTPPIFKERKWREGQTLPPNCGFCNLGGVGGGSFVGGGSAIRKASFLLSLLALALSLVNLLAMEYFFILELLRVGLIFALLRDAEDPPARWTRSLKPALRYALPYLALFVGAALWRAFFFRFQTQNYEIGLMDQLRADPLTALGALIGGALTDLFNVAAAAWARPFLPSNLSGLGARSTLLWAAVTLAALVFSGLFLLRRRAPRALRAPGWPLAAVLLGLAALLLAGPPFWLTRLVIHLDYPNNRFTLPFMPGAALLLTGLIGLLPGRRLYKAGLVLLLAAAAVGYQFQQGVSFQRDWKTHNALFWQMQWRMPSIKENTILVSSNLPLRYFSDNSLAGPLNWIYAGTDVAEGEMPYMYYFASVRSVLRPLFQPGNAITQDYLAATFHGSTDQMVAVTFAPPGCLRVLDPDLDAANTMLPELMRQAAPLSNAGQILPAPERTLTPEIFGAEPARGWCYFYEKADLARQLGDWEGVTRLGEQAFASGDYPNDPMERLPFIEGYAHTGDWQRARELTDESASITPLMQPVLCKLWARIAAVLPGPEAQSVLADLSCPAQP